MARKVKRRSTGANSSRKQNGARPTVEHSSSPIRESDEQNYEPQVSDDDASHYEGSGTRATSRVASPERNEPLDSEDDGEFGEQPKTRGPNRGMDVPEDIEDRPTIFTIGGRFPDTRVTSDISVTIKANFEDAWGTWRSVPQSMRDLYWDKFKKHFKWPVGGEDQIYEAWCKTCSDRFRDILGLARKNAKKVSGSKNARDWIDKNPLWMNRNVWNKLIKDVWSKPEWQNRSDSGTKNRLSGNNKASPTYTGGSVPMSAHIYKMRKELKRNPTELELFDRTHKTDGEYVSPKFKKVRETYDKIIEEKYPDPELRPNFDITVWNDARGGAYKKRPHGFGPTRRAFSLLADGRGELIDVEGRSLDQGSLGNMIKVKIDECTKEMVNNLKTILPDMVCEVLEHLRQNNMEDEQDRSSYESYDSYEDDSEINMENSRRHRIYAKKHVKNHASGKISSNGDQHESSQKHKKARKQK